MTRSVALIAALLVFGIAASPSQAAVDYEVRGTWTCRGESAVEPIAGARVELYRSRSWWPDERMRVAHTAADGSFDFFVRADSNSTFYVNLELIGGGVDLENWYSPFNWSTETGGRKAASGLVDLGTWEIARSDGASGSPKCQIWQGAHDAYADFRAVVGSAAPSEYGIEADFPCCGVPFTTTDTTRWPAGYSTGVGNRTSFHEFAHAMRHSLDGGFAHFLVDAGRFLYPQFHEPCKLTNEGFAFNEGWAEYWARTPQTCGDGTNMSYEGNVAAALTGLERCTGRPQMVRVLRESPTGLTLSSGIHSWSEFQSRFFELYGTRVCTTPRFGSTVTDPVISSGEVRNDLRSQISAQVSLIGSLALQQRQATEAAGGVEPCRGTGCEAAMQSVIAPAAIGAQRAQARLVLARLRQALATARRARFRTFHRSQFVKGLARSRRAFVQRNEVILIAGLRRHRGDRRRGRDQGRAIHRARPDAATPARCRAASEEAGNPASGAHALAVRAAGTAARGRHAGARRAASSAAASGGRIHGAVADVSRGREHRHRTALHGDGHARAGAVRGHHPRGLHAARRDAFTRTTMADGTGGWSHTIDPQTDHGDGLTFGDWTAQARFDGAPGFAPSESSTCTVTVTD